MICELCKQERDISFFGINKSKFSNICFECRKSVYKIKKSNIPVQKHFKVAHMVSYKSATRDQHKCIRRPQIDQFTGEEYTKDYYELDFGI